MIQLIQENIAGLTRYKLYQSLSRREARTVFIW